MSKVHRLSLLGFAACALSACDSQVTPRYVGEPLMKLSGSVTISDDHTEGPLVPALAFENEELSRLEIMDVASQGKFPSNFTLEIYTPPPASSLVEDPAGGSRYALGYVTAIRKNHKPRVNFTENTAEAGWCDAQACYIQREFCDHRATSCYMETSTCDLQRENCEVTDSSGDPFLGEDPWKSFAGLSSNYQVLYLQHDLAADSPGAKHFADGAPIAAGYHLLEVHELTPEEGEALEQCFSEVEAEVVGAYNDAHGTAYEDVFDVKHGCASQSAPCADPEETLEELRAQVERGAAQRACFLDELKYALVPEPESAPINIRIARPEGPLTLAPF